MWRAVWSRPKSDVARWMERFTATEHRAAAINKLTRFWKARDERVRGVHPGLAAARDEHRRVALRHLVAEHVMVLGEMERTRCW